MGLDQYAFTKEPTDTEAVEIAYWRKHNRLQGWMHKLWLDKKEEAENKPVEEKFIDALDDDNKFDDTFNCAELDLELKDIEELERVINNRELPETDGFFYGSDSYEDYESEYGYKNKDVEFVENAKKALKAGKEVFYTCSY